MLLRTFDLTKIMENLNFTLQSMVKWNIEIICKTTYRRATRTEIWDSGTVIEHICDHELFKVNWVSFGAKRYYKTYESVGENVFAGCWRWSPKNWLKIFGIWGFQFVRNFFFVNLKFTIVPYGYTKKDNNYLERSHSEIWDSRHW